MSAESTVSRNYLDWLLAVPWKQKTREIRDLKYAREVLESDHYGLDKIKERILEITIPCLPYIYASRCKDGGMKLVTA